MNDGRILVIAMTAAIGLLATACGDSAEPLTKPAYVEQANAICQESNDELEVIFDEFYTDFDDFDMESPEDMDLMFIGFEEMIDKALPVFEQQLDDLRDLVPPDEDGDLIKDLLAEFDSAIEEMDELIEAAAAGDDSARQKFDDDDFDPFEDVNRRAREYGLTVCGDENN